MYMPWEVLKCLVIFFWVEINLMVSFRWDRCNNFSTSHQHFHYKWMHVHCEQRNRPTHTQVWMHFFLQWPGIRFKTNNMLLERLFLNVWNGPVWSMIDVGEFWTLFPKVCIQAPAFFLYFWGHQSFRVTGGSTTNECMYYSLLVNWKYAGKCCKSRFFSSLFTNTTASHFKFARLNSCMLLYVFIRSHQDGPWRRVFLTKIK
jgi:hypothetical protein